VLAAVKQGDVVAVPQGGFGEMAPEKNGAAQDQ
jgi:hypothetical protein